MASAIEHKRLMAQALLEKLRRAEECRMLYYRPYQRQKEFHHKSLVRERLFMAGNQLGKTVAGAYEMACHLTGRYPDWWTGRKFSKPIVAWATGITGGSVRETTQRLLVGRPGQYGTGMIPKECIVGEPKKAVGVPDLLDSVEVLHVTGGTSRVSFKSYEKGREKWQGETLDVVWFDEEPPEDIYTEGLTRTNATGGIVYLTFTPLLGMSNVIRRFLTEKSPDRAVITMTIHDVDHYSPEQRKRIIDSYPAHEREARANGIPTLGDGAIFPVPESLIKCEPFQIPAWWPQIGGIDFGWDHPTAAVKLAWDRDTDTVYVTATHRLQRATPMIHAATLKPWGSWLNWSWPHDGLQHSKDSGVTLADQYRKQGLLMLPERATFPDGSNGVEAGVMLMLDMMQSGRFKVFSHLNDFFEEFRMYHRKNGKIVKEMDDILSAVRYGIMSLRFATCEPKPRSNHDAMKFVDRTGYQGY